MPRRHDRARERPGPPIQVERPLTATPAWAQAGGAIVRAVTGEKGKTYRCPGCQQEIRPGTPHLVVIEDEDVEARRHWHTPCWKRELRRRGFPVA